MPKAKRKKPHNPAKAHDRRARDLLRNAEVATVEVDNPLAMEPGEKIVALRSIRNDPARSLHSHRQIDEAQYQGGRAFQPTGRRPSADRAQSIRPGNMSMAGRGVSRSPKASARPCCG